MAEICYVGFKLVVNHPTPSHFTSLLEENGEKKHGQENVPGENMWVTFHVNVAREKKTLSRGGDG